MRRIRFTEPRDPKNGDWSPVEVVVSEEDVRRDYWPFWCEQMKKAHKEHLISFEKCWIDYKMIHWGEDV